MKFSLTKREVRRAAHRISLALLIMAQGLLPNAIFAAAGPKRFPVTTEMVVMAMQSRQLPTEGVEVKLAAPVTAASINPMLEIQTITPVNLHAAQLKVACQDHTQCISFYVSATWPESSEGIPSTPLRHSERPQAIAQHTQGSTELAVKSGSHATLLIEDGKVHIRLQVVCLQGGSAGDRVRVSSPDRKVAYKAEIVAPNLLKGSF